MTESAAELILVLMTSASLLLHGLATPRPAAVRRVVSSSSVTAGEGALIALVVLTMVVIPLLDYSVPWFEFADFVFFDQVAWVGLVLGSGAVWLFWRARSDWLCLRPDNEVMDRGVYRHLRHPFYAAMLLWALAQLLLLQNWLGGPAAAFTFAIVYLLRVPLEEQQRLERHGHRYLDYMERTGGIFPRLTRHRID